jgi:hypothetical protein
MLVTQAEYARRRGISRQAVNKAIAMGRITAVDGKVELSTADQEWWENTDRSQLRLLPEAAAAAAAPPAVGNGKSNGVTPKVASPDSGRRPRARKDTFNFQRARREETNAELAKLDLEERIGNLVARDGVRKAQFEVARELRDALEEIPQLAPLLAPLSSEAECRALLADAIEKLCARVAAQLEQPDG